MIRLRRLAALHGGRGRGRGLRAGAPREAAPAGVRRGGVRRDRRPLRRRQEQAPGGVPVAAQRRAVIGRRRRSWVGIDCQHCFFFLRQSQH